MSVLQLDAFESSIKGRKIQWFLAPDSTIGYPPGFQEQIIESPIQRRILVLSHTSSEAWKLVDRWDLVLVPQTGIDWSLLITILQNFPPTLVVCAPEVQAPAAFYQKCNGTTLICLRYLVSITPLVRFDATFFPPAQSCEEEPTNALLQSLLTQETLRKLVLKDVLRDLKSAGATLVVSTIEESIPSLYWYYTSESAPSSRRLLDTVIQTLLKRNV
jgi:hypothetical protein